MTRNEHLLTILAEECAEIAQRVSKALRFSLAEIQPGQDLTNEERIEGEIHDLIAVAEMLNSEGVMITWPAPETVAAKKAKVEKFLKLSAANGTLVEPNAMDEANASLIAAAPELLEALKALRIQALQSTVNDRANEWGMEALGLAHAAIAKAEA